MAVSAEVFPKKGAMSNFDLHNFPDQLVAVVATFVLCLLLGIERQFHQKNAGVKTHVLVGVGSCLFTLVSAYGFTPPDAGDMDRSRIAAQIVSGIGFLGAGVIFVNNDTVKGLTTAATVWVSAAIGMACGAHMIPVAIVALVLHYALIFLLGPLSNRLPSSRRNNRTVIEYEAGHGVMRRILLTATRHGYRATVNSTSSITTEEGQGMRVFMRFEGPYPQDALVRALSEVEGVHAVDVVEPGDLD